MPYRICKTFEIESGHMLSKHAERCRFPQGHSRRIEIILSAEKLDDHDMVTDFKAIKNAIQDYLDQYDHAMMINSDDSFLPALQKASERVIVFQNVDPTTEVMAKAIFDYVAQRIQEPGPITNGETYQFPEDLTLEKVRVWETSTSWAEFSIN